MTDMSASTRPQGAPQLGVDRSPGMVLVLSIITLGIYFLWWYFTVNAEIKRYNSSIEVEPGIALLAQFIPIANFISAFNTAKRVQQMQAEAGQPEISPVVALVWYLLLGIIYPYYVASQLQKFWASQR